MITEFLINMGFRVAGWVFKLLPDFEWSVASSAWTVAKDILDGVCYFLPLETVVQISTLIISLAMLRVTFKFIGIVIDLIPFIG